MFCFTTFQYTARSDVQTNVRETDYRTWNERVLATPEGQIVPLPQPLIRIILE